VNDPRSKTLITVDELARLMDAGTAVVLLDVIDEQGAAPDDRPKIPGALSVHLATDFSGKATPAAGRRPLPDVSDLQAKARAWGICSDSIVVAYDNSGGAQASRAWWTLRWAGLANVRVLDGGYAAWVAANRPSSNHVATRATRAGDVVLTTGRMPTISAEEALRWGLVAAVASPVDRDDELVALARSILVAGPQAVRLQKSLILEWEELPTAAAIERGIDCFVGAFDTDEPARMAGALLSKLRSRRK